uniref:Uncharacterized protein n=1 Tax=Panagrolaimus sp. ES5 TaxID=591445 RepID=A0AC34FRU8_9BILA
MDDYFKSLERQNRRKRKETDNENHNESGNSENAEVIILDDNEDDDEEENVPQQSLEFKQHQQQQLISIKDLFKTPRKTDDKEYRRKQARLQKQKSRASLSEERRDAVRAADRKRKSTSKTPDQITIGSQTSQNSSVSSTPKDQITIGSQTSRNSSISLTPKNQKRSQIFDSQDDEIIIDAVLPPPSKTRPNSQIVILNSQSSFNYDSQSQIFVDDSPQPSQNLQFQQSQNLADFHDSQLPQNQLMKSINDIIALIEIVLNFEDNGIEVFASILSESEEAEFLESNIEEKISKFEVKKIEIYKNIMDSIEKLIENNTDAKLIKQSIIENCEETEASMIASFIFDGIENVEDIEEIQIMILLNLQKFCSRFQQSQNLADFHDSQIVQNQLIKNINDIISLIEIILNFEDNGVEVFASILSESEEAEFLQSNIEEKILKFEAKKIEIYKNIMDSIEKLIENNTDAKLIKQSIIENCEETEASLIASFIFDGIQNVEDTEEIQIATLISTIRLYIQKAKYVSKKAFDETAKVRESLKKLLNKTIAGIEGTEDYENRKILGFSFHVVNRNEHVTVGFPIREIFPQIFNNFMTMNGNNSDYIFLHPGKRNSTIPNNEIQYDIVGSNTSSETPTVPNSSQTSTVPNSQASTTSNGSSQNSSQICITSQEQFLEMDIIQSEGFTNRTQARTYIDATRGFLCTSECPAVPANFSKNLIPHLRNLAYANSSNIFYAVEDFRNKCLQLINLHAPCFQ